MVVIERKNIGEQHGRNVLTTKFRGFTTILRGFPTEIGILKRENEPLIPTAMETRTEKHPILNRLLSALNFGLEVILLLIALGFLIGLYSLLS